MLHRSRSPAPVTAHAPGSPPPPAVGCRGLARSFGPVAAVRDFSLEVSPGEIMALLGPSGCGKTTFLRLVAGFERPDTGTIELSGRIVAGKGRYVPPERRRVGVVFQDYALFPHLTVGGNAGYGVDASARRSRVHEVLDLVGLAGLEDRYPHELSGGQQQRVALARALAPEPSLLLLDEPFSNLDAALRVRVRAEVRDILRAAGTATIFVTHDQEEALSLADRVAIMARGRLHQVDPPDRVYTRPADAFVAGFVGGANLLDGWSDGHDVGCSVGTLNPLQAPPPGPAVIVVRPESLRLRPEPSGPAVVTRATFYGHDQLVEVRMPDGTTVRSRMGPARFFETGDRVGVVVVADEVIAFARDEPPPQ
ncbi:MAG TPA: ABC transporter ATP-binding protein [Actinomycetota bacterium]|nr:ABC transporter ATP-binding protein [Actinomycetota bacterium]